MRKAQVGTISRRLSAWTTAACCLSYAVLLMACKPEPEPAAAALQSVDGERIGTAEFAESKGGVRVKVDVSKLPPGRYAFQIHEYGSCKPPGFLSAGGPYPAPEEVGMVTQVSPALERSLGEFEVGEEGWGSAEAIAPVVTLDSGANSLFHKNGTSLVITALTGAGVYGGRVACGPISRATGEEEVIEQLPAGDLESAGTPDNVGTPGKIYQQPR